MNRKQSPETAYDPSESTIDRTDRAILSALQGAARMSYAELGRTVSLSAPAVAERVRRLERSGIIEGYHARVSPVALGRPITAYIRVAIEGTPSRQRRLVEHVESITSVEECHGLTGEDSYLIKVCVATTEELDRLTSTFSTYGRTTTSVVLSSPVVRAGITPG